MTDQEQIQELRAQLARAAEMIRIKDALIAKQVSRIVHLEGAKR